VEAERANRVIEPFEKRRHSRENFSCEVESLERYFRTQAGQGVKSKAAAVFVVAEGSNVLGNYTLSSYAIDAGELSPDITCKLPSYPKLPAILIGHLARDQKYRGQWQRGTPAGKFPDHPDKLFMLMSTVREMFSA